MELEAGDSGLRSLVSVQGSLAMYSIWKHGSQEQKNEHPETLATRASLSPADSQQRPRIKSPQALR
jgi:Acyl-CoA dehydrogenase, N-terminal domain